MSTSKLLALLPELGIFVTVVDENSFSAAGRKLNLPPSSISRTIARLEGRLTCKLLERTTRRLALTPVGKETYAMAKEMLASAQAAVNAAQSQQHNLAGTLRIAAPKAFCKFILSPIVFDFMTQHPSLTVQLLVSDHFIDPSSGIVDLTIRLTNQPMEGLVARYLGSMKQILCASPDYLNAQGRPQHPDELIQHQCITLGESESDNVWHFQCKDESAKVKTQGRFISNHSEIRREAVLRHLGISIFPEFAIQAELASGTVEQVLKTWHFIGTYQGQIVAQYAQSRYVPAAIRQFIDYTKERLEENTRYSKETI